MSEIMVRERFLRSGKKYMSIHLRWQVLMEKESINPKSQHMKYPYLPLPVPHFHIQIMLFFQLFLRPFY